MRRVHSLLLFSSWLMCLAVLRAGTPPRQPAPVSVPGAGGSTRIGRWHGPARADAPVAVILCERDACPAAIVPALWRALETEGVRSLTVDPAPVVPERDALIEDVRSFQRELRRQFGSAPSRVDLIGAGVAGMAMLNSAVSMSDAAFVVVIGPDLGPADSSRDTIASLGIRGGPPTLLMFAGVLQPGAAISASLDTLLKAPVHRPIDISVKGSGEGPSAVADDVSMWIAAQLRRR